MTITKKYVNYFTNDLRFHMRCNKRYEHNNRILLSAFNYIHFISDKYSVVQYEHFSFEIFPFSEKLE